MRTSFKYRPILYCVYFSYIYLRYENSGLKSLIQVIPQGADITARTNAGVSALSMIVRKIPNVLPKFEDMLDHAITLAGTLFNRKISLELWLEKKLEIPYLILINV